MLQRWEGFAEMATTGMDELHPEEKAWKAIIASENKEKISEFTKHESLLLVGPISAATTNFVSSLKTFCAETPIEAIRTWHETSLDAEKEGKIWQLEISQTQAKLVLAVATAAKAIFLKVPKQKTREEKNKVLEKAKKHVLSAKLGKAFPQSIHVLCQSVRVVRVFIQVVFCYRAPSFHSSVFCQVFPNDIMAMLNNS